MAFCYASMKLKLVWPGSIHFILGHNTFCFMFCSASFQHKQHSNKAKGLGAAIKRLQANLQWILAIFQFMIFKSL